MAGRKKKQIDKEQFEELLSLQCTKEDISGFFHGSHDTIERWCKRTYGKNFLSVAEDYRSIGRVSLRRSQFAMAERGNVPMLIHLGKQYLGQTDKTETKVTGDLNVKHGTITKIAYYDPETREMTREEITGREDDVDAYLSDRDNYIGDTMTFKLPEKDGDPELSEIEGEKTIVNRSGTVRAHLPWNKKDIPPALASKLDKTIPIEIKTRSKDGDTVIMETADDGRGGYTGDPQTDLIIEQAIDENRRVRLNWMDNKRGGHLPRKKTPQI